MIVLKGLITEASKKKVKQITDLLFFYFHLFVCLFSQLSDDGVVHLADG